jgi:aminoglycoside phosphotransferase
MTNKSKNTIGNFFEDFSINQTLEHSTSRTITHGDSCIPLFMEQGLPYILLMNLQKNLN